MRRLPKLNYEQFIDRFDEVFILDVDRKTLESRLDARVDEWGSKKNERDLVLHLHDTKEDVPQNGIIINATMPLPDVVSAILDHIEK